MMNLYSYTVYTCACSPLTCIEYTWVYDSPCICQTYSLALAAKVRRCCWNPMEVCDDGRCRHSPYFDAPWPSNLWQKRLSLFWRSMVPSARQSHILARKLSDDFLNGAVEQTKCFRDGTPCITLRHSLNWWNFISCYIILAVPNRIHQIQVTYGYIMLHLIYSKVIKVSIFVSYYRSLILVNAFFSLFGSL